MNQEIKTSIYDLESGSYQVSFVHPINRKRMRRKFRLKKEAEQFAEDIKNQFSANGLNNSSALPVLRWMKLYLEANRNAFIKRLGEPLFLSFLDRFGKMPAMNVGNEELATWLTELKTARSYSDRTLPNIRSAINQFFQFVVDAGGLRINPMTKVKVVKGLPTRERTILDEKEISDLLEKAQSLSPNLFYPVVFLLAHTGARLGEILKLKWQHVNFELGSLHLVKTKNGNDRLIHVTAQVLDFLRTLPQENDYVVVNMYGEGWTDSQYRKQFTKFRRKIGFEKYWTNHILRHSFASNYQKQGGDMYQLQKHLGHSSLQMTVDLYGKIDPSDIQNPSPFDI